MLLDEFADVKLSIHTHDMSHPWHDLDVETSTWKCFSILIISSLFSDEVK
jgi:hypothetical protein